MASTGGRVRCGEGCDCRVAGIGDDGFIAAFLHHVFDQSSLYGVIIGDQNTGSHGFTPHATLFVSNRGNVAETD